MWHMHVILFPSLSSLLLPLSSSSLSPPPRSPPPPPSFPQMCIRINNIHALISIFPSLESHVYSTTFSPAQRFPFTAFGSGALSSATTTESTSLLQSMEMHTGRPNPHRYRAEQSNTSSFQLLPTQGSEQTSSDASVFGISPSQRRKMESGFQSGESKHVMEYLRRTLDYQLKMLSIRVWWNLLSHH